MKIVSFFCSLWRLSDFTHWQRGLICANIVTRFALYNPTRRGILGESMLSLLIFTALLGYFIIRYFYKIRKYPPGPLPWPLVGNAIQFIRGGNRPGGIRTVLHEYTKKYGPVYTLWFGNIPVVFVNDFEIGQETMVKKGGAFADRLNVFIGDITRQGRGIINANGHHWVEQRRFALHTLRDFGLGRNLMEERIMLEFDYRTKLLDKEIDKAGGKLLWNPSEFAMLTVGNIINRMLFSERFTEEKEAEFFKLKERMDEIMENSTVVDGILRDWNKSWPYFKDRYNMMKNAEEAVIDFVKQQITEKKKSRDAGKEYSDDFVDIYLSKMATGEYSDEFNEETLAITLFDLWSAGQETTNTALYWAIAYLVRYPKTFKKLQKEMDEVTGRSRSVSLTDRPKTPYLNAVIQETLRVISFLPVNVLLRCVSEDITVGGYVIPKDTGCAFQMSVVMSDEKNFKDPYEFKPERFLEGENEQKVVAFGIGKRACPGEGLARAELYVILANLALSYDLEGIADKLPKMEAIKETVVIRKAQPYEIFVSKRK